MNGMNYGTEMPEQNELDAALKGYVEAIAKNPNKKLTTAWLNGFDGIVGAYLGEYPETFEADGKTFTPEEYRDYLGINPADYVNLSSFTHHPFYSQFIIEVPDNWRWDTAYNLPIDELMEVMYNAIDKGYSIAWGSDVSEKGFTRNGLATMPVEKKKKTAGSDQEKWVGKAAEENKDEKKEEEKNVLPEEIIATQEMRQADYDRKLTTDDHGMHIYGIAQDQNGTKYFMVKNSWGETGKYKGTWYASDAFVRYKTMNIVVHKNALPKHIAKKLGIK
jgi:aminopeptidase C